MCLINCNIEVEENKDKKINSDLTYEDRLKIEDMIRSRTKYTIQEIADKIGRNKSIVSREIKRNGYEKWDERTARYKNMYSAAKAQGKYEYRKKNAGRKSALEKDRALKQFIEDKIKKEKWSPKEVAGYIKKKDIKFKIQPSFQAIYYWIENKQIDIKEIDLVHKVKLEKREKKEKVLKVAKHEEKSIHKRPEEIKRNEVFGHWELDCVEGNKESKKTYMTLLERVTKKYIVIEMKEHTNQCVKEGIDRLEEKYGKHFKEIFKSMTTDNGHEFLNYDNIEKSKRNKEERRTIVYYADPYSAWQKGMNENCNGILRRFIPKGTDLNKITTEHLEKIIKKINGKPRAILDYQTADELFDKEIRKIIA